MQKFRYNLQRILSLKERKEELLKQEMARLLFRKQAHEKVKSYYERLLKEEYNKMREKNIFVSAEHLLQENFVNSIKNNIYSQRLLIREYEMKIEQKRKEIMENRKEIKTLQKLKERKLEEYNYELMVDERKTMDEIANRLSFVEH
jgi:flagellar protein FliJ